MKETLALIRVFSYLSLLTVGGGMAAFPELKVLTVDVHHWLTFRQLIHLYSIGQIAPGPNMMMIVTIGHMAGGVLGAIVVLFAFFGPTAVLAWSIGRLWERLANWPWRKSIERGLAPVAIGLLLAGCFTIASGAITGVIGVVIALISFIVLVRSTINPIALVAAGAFVGWLTCYRPH